MEISHQNLSNLQTKGTATKIQTGLLRKAMDMNESQAAKLLDTLPSYKVDTNAAPGQQVRIRA